MVVGCQCPGCAQCWLVEGQGPGCRNDIRRYDRKWVDPSTGGRRCASCAEAATRAGNGECSRERCRSAPCSRPEAAASAEAAAAVPARVAGSGAGAIQHPASDIQSQVTVMRQQMSDIQAQIAMQQQMSDVQSQLTRMQDHISQVQAQMAEMTETSNTIWRMLHVFFTMVAQLIKK